MIPLITLNLFQGPSASTFEVVKWMLKQVQHDDLESA